MTKQEFNKVVIELTEMHHNVYGSDTDVNIFSLANVIEQYSGNSYYNRALSIGLTEDWIEETM